MFRTFSQLILAAALAMASELPRADLHVHTDSEGGSGPKELAPAEVTALSQKLGVKFGVLAEGGCAGEIHDDATLAAFLDKFQGQPVYRGLQVYGFEWRKCLSKDNLARLDYIAADALIFPDRGRNVMLWLDGVRFDDAQDFMERYVAFNEKVLAQPIQVWANPTYLPESMKSRYDELWTPERMKRLIGAAVKNHVAIELNTKFRIPSPAFVRAAKAAGAKFTFGSNGHIKGIGDISYGLEIAKECGLTGSDFLTLRSR
ncbi:MAG: hypothetical protein ACM336_02290 [Acidobacteriota bacterium]